MNAWRQTLSLFMIGGLATSVACKGDDDEDTGADATLTETDPSTSGTASTTMTSTTEPSTTMTTDDSETDPSTTMTTDMTMTTMDPDSTGEPGGPAAFRFNSIAVRDPHLFVNVVVEMDITESNVNTPLNAALNEDMTDPPDGFLDLGFVLSFEPLDQTEGGTGAVAFANAQCMAGADPVSCGVLPATEAYDATFVSQTAGECQAPDAANINPAYTPAPQTTTGPCFVSSGIDVTITTASFALPMTGATVAARYVGDPAGNLVEGSIIGFVTQAAADSAILAKDLPVVGGQPLSNLLKDEDKDMDGAGWYFHIDFTAIPATYTGG